MRFIDFQKRFGDFPLFTLSDIRKHEPHFRRALLNAWQVKGYILKVRRGYYLFADAQPRSFDALALIAHRLYAPSYISLEMALAQYGLIPEGVYTVTAITTRKSIHFETPVGSFSYRHIKPEAFVGYHLRKAHGQAYSFADMEKAVLDYCALHPGIVDEDEFFEWRFASDLFMEKMDEQKYHSYVRAFGNQAFQKRATSLLTLIKDHAHAS
jgi:predicted transcriptional regulator of viral defense system